MFRMEFCEVGPTLLVRIEGRFVGHYAQEATLLIAHRHVPARLIVDISEVTYLDRNGEEALIWLGRMGATFIAECSYALDVCDRLRLRLSQTRPTSRAQQAAD